MTVLVVAAHMDDEVLGAGGTIARHRAAGDSVTIWVACPRVYDHRLDPKKIEEEKSSCHQAASALGVQQLRFADLKDEQLDARLLDVIVPLEECLGEVKPAVVYLPHGGDANQDHRAVFQAALVSCRTIARHKARRLLCYEVLSSTEQAPPLAGYAFLPNFYVDITGTLEKKITAMRCYRRELRKFPHPRSLKGIEVLAQKRGMEAGVPAAEAFMLIRDLWA